MIKETINYIQHQGTSQRREDLEMSGRMNYYGGGGWPSNQQQSWPYGGGRSSSNQYSNYGSQQQSSYGSQNYGSSSGGYSQQGRSADQGYADPNSMRRGGNRGSWQEQPQPVTPVQRNPVKRVANTTVRQTSSNPTSRQQRPYNPPPSDDEDDVDYFSSGIRPVPTQRRVATVKKIPTTNASSFTNAETALCLVPQTPSITEITRLLKGDKGEPGTPGDNFFEQTGEDVKLLRGSNLTVPGVLRATSLEVANPKGPLIVAIGEGVTGEDGQLTIQLSREIRGTWTKENTKILLTARQACMGLFLPLEGMEPEHNQFTVHCIEKQRVAFDWVMIRF